MNASILLLLEKYMALNNLVCSSNNKNENKNESLIYGFSPHQNATFIDPLNKEEGKYNHLFF